MHVINYVHSKTAINTWSSLRGRVKCCTPSVRPSVRLSVCPVPTIYSKSGSHRNFKFGGDITPDACNYQNNPWPIVHISLNSLHFYISPAEMRLFVCLPVCRILSFTRNLNVAESSYFIGRLVLTSDFEIKVTRKENVQMFTQRCKIILRAYFRRFNRDMATFF